MIRQREGIKRYILTAIDPKTHIAFAYAPPTGNSAHAAKLHEAITHKFPDYAKAKALTDNGSEFKGHFAKRMTEHEVMHWKTYPKTPKMNAHCERSIAASKKASLTTTRICSSPTWPCSIKK